MIDQSTIDKILQAANIVDVISDFVTLRKKGINYLGLCPFHDDNSPSFLVSPAKQICKCFSCGEGGNVISFLQKHENLSYQEALKYLGKKYNIEIDNVELTSEQKAKHNKRESLRAILNFCQAAFEKNLIEHQPAMEYLSGRKINPVILRKFGVGYAEKQQFPSMLVCNSYSPDLARDAGVIGRNEYGAYYDYFRNRITFPFYDIYGNITGFTGRALDPAGNIKYLNTPETELFNKGSVLYGLFQAKAAIAKDNLVYLTEGQFDVLAMVQAGMENTVCGSGTALTPAQIKLLKRFTQNVTLVYDNDSADPDNNPGLKACLKNGELLLASGFNVRVVMLPEGEDPDSYLKNGGNTAIFTDSSRYRDIISYKYEIIKIKSPGNDPIQVTENYKAIAKTIALIPEKTTRANYITHLVDKYKVDGEQIKSLIKQMNLQQDKPETKSSGFQGLEDAKELISKQKPVIQLTGNMETFIADFGEKPIVYYCGEISYSQIQELMRVSSFIEFVDAISYPIDFNTLEEKEEITFLKELHKSGFTIELKDTQDENGDDNHLQYGFLDYYVIMLSRLTKYSRYVANNNVKSELIDRAAEMISCIPDSERNVGIKSYCKYFDVTAKAMNDTLKPYLEKKKARSKFKSDNFSVDGEMLNMNLDMDKIPDYVDITFLNRFGFFPLQTNAGKKVAYMFRNETGAFTRVANFFMTPLFHVYDKTGFNKRVVQLDHIQMPFPIFVEWISKDMINLTSFRQLIWDEGGLVFENGTSRHLDKILSSIAMEFPKCFELKVFGQQNEDFFAFSNAIYHIVDEHHEVEYVNEYGIVNHNGVNYYAPAFSKIYSGDRQENDKFAQDRYFIYKELPPEQQTDFTTWASLMNRVYKQNENGKWALLFSVMSAFRSVIYPIDRLFTSLFFVGPTESGKSQIAVSIRSLYIHPDAPLFNLNSGTDAAFFTAMERYRDVPVIFEEYNDYTISDIKFQGLKAAVYDGEGKQKRKDAASKELDISQVNAVPVLLGQESPQKDDGSLYNRSVVCEVPKKDDWTDGEREIFQELKEREKRGLSPVLIEVLKLRPVFSSHFKSIQRDCFKQLKNEVSKTHGSLDGQTRILNTVSLFLATCRMLEKYAPHLKLPFEYDAFLKIAKEKVIKQAESISSANRLAVYFNSIQYLIEQESLLYGKDLKIDQQAKLTVKINRKETIEVQLPALDTKVLYLRLSVIHPLYARMHQAKDVLTESSLMVNLSSHPAFIGTVKSTRFKWNTVKEVPGGIIDPVMKKIVVREDANSSAVALNYDILKEFIDIDLERFIDTGNDESETKEDVKPGEMPF